jgi:hypothetical protein
MGFDGSVTDVIIADQEVRATWKESENESESAFGDSGRADDGSSGRRSNLFHMHFEDPEHALTDPVRQKDTGCKRRQHCTNQHDRITH